ncbi:MAG: hypothetical protein M0Q95_08690 [Porticoccaceae bacterium]|nr:hypothetical protein [Porticoccaceae bacterium]
MPDLAAEHFRVIRDIEGRLHLVVPDETDDALLDALNETLIARLQHFAGSSRPAVRAGDTLTGEALLSEPVLIQIVDGFPCRVIERRAMGSDWIVQPDDNSSDDSKRFVFFSLKGGVGRSTALALWARHLCQQGKTVLVIDLDLEAPGLGAQLLESTGKPQYGIADWLVHDLVGANTAELPSQMCRQSPVADVGLWVAPAFGAKTDLNRENVIAKLARAYLDKQDDDGLVSYASRLKIMVKALELEYQPDVVLIDSRAGLHETVAAPLLHLNAEVLCFAVDMPVTWQGYKYLFSHLAQLAQTSITLGLATSWRDRIQMVSARALPGTRAEFIANAYSLWVDTLYDEQEPEDGDVFSFDERNESAPHYPIVIPRSDLFERFDPVKQLNELSESQINETFGAFFKAMWQRLESTQ